MDVVIGISAQASPSVEKNLSKLKGSIKSLSEYLGISTEEAKVLFKELGKTPKEIASAIKQMGGISSVLSDADEAAATLANSLGVSSSQAKQLTSILSKASKESFDAEGLINLSKVMGITTQEAQAMADRVGASATELAEAAKWMQSLDVETVDAAHAIAFLRQKTGMTVEQIDRLSAVIEQWRSAQQRALDNSPKVFDEVAKAVGATSEELQELALQTGLTGAEIQKLVPVIGKLASEGASFGILENLEEAHDSFKKTAPVVKNLADAVAEADAEYRDMIEGELSRVKQAHEEAFSAVPEIQANKESIRELEIALQNYQQRLEDVKAAEAERVDFERRAKENTYQNKISAASAIGGGRMQDVEQLSSRTGMTASEIEKAAIAIATLKEQGREAAEIYDTLTQEIGLTEYQYQDLAGTIDHVAERNARQSEEAKKAAEEEERLIKEKTRALEIAANKEIEQAKKIQDQQEKLLETRRDAAEELYSFIEQAGVSVVEGLSSFLSGAISEFRKFDEVMTQIKLVSGEGKDALAVLGDEIISLGQSTVFTQEEIADAALNLSRTGFTGQEQVSALKGIALAAQATGSDLSDTATIIAEAIRGFGLRATDAVKVADVLAQAANKTNVSIESLGDSFTYVAAQAAGSGQSLEDTTTLIGVLGDAGQVGSIAGTGLAQVYTRLKVASAGAQTELDGLVKGSIKQTKAFEQLSATIRSADGSMVGLLDALPEIRAQLMGLSQADKDVVLQALFGVQGANAFLSILNTSQQRIDELRKSIQFSEGTTAEASRILDESFSISVEQLAGQIDAILTGLGSVFGGTLKPLIDGIITLVSAFLDLPTPIQAVILSMGAFTGIIAGAGLSLAALRLSMGPVIVAQIQLAKEAFAVALGLRAQAAASADAARAAVVLRSSMAAVAKSTALIAGVLTVFSGLSSVYSDTYEAAKNIAEETEKIASSIRGLEDAIAAARAAAGQDTTSYEARAKANIEAMQEELSWWSKLAQGPAKFYQETLNLGRGMSQLAQDPRGEQALRDWVESMNLEDGPLKGAATGAIDSIAWFNQDVIGTLTSAPPVSDESEIALQDWLESQDIGAGPQAGRARSVVESFEEFQGTVQEAIENGNKYLAEATPKTKEDLEGYVGIIEAALTQARSNRLQLLDPESLRQNDKAISDLEAQGRKLRDALAVLEAAQIRPDVKLGKSLDDLLKSIDTEALEQKTEALQNFSGGLREFEKEINDIDAKAIQEKITSLEQYLEDLADIPIAGDPTAREKTISETREQIQSLNQELLGINTQEIEAQLTEVDRIFNRHKLDALTSGENIDEQIAKAEKDASNARIKIYAQGMAKLKQMGIQSTAEAEQARLEAIQDYEDQIVSIRIERAEKTAEAIKEIQELESARKEDLDKSRLALEEEIAERQVELQQQLQDNEQKFADEQEQARLDFESEVLDRRGKFEDEILDRRKKFDQDSQKEWSKFQEQQAKDKAQFELDLQKRIADLKKSEEERIIDQEIERRVALSQAATPQERKDLEKQFTEEDAKRAAQLKAEQEASLAVEQDRASILSKAEREGQYDIQTATEERRAQEERAAFEQQQAEERKQQQEELDASRTDLEDQIVEDRAQLEDEISTDRAEFLNQQQDDELAFLAEQRQLQADFQTESQNSWADFWSEQRKLDRENAEAIAKIREREGILTRVQQLQSQQQGLRSEVQGKRDFLAMAAANPEYKFQTAGIAEEIAALEASIASLETAIQGAQASANAITTELNKPDAPRPERVTADQIPMTDRERLLRERQDAERQAIQERIATEGAFQETQRQADATHRETQRQADLATAREIVDLFSKPGNVVDLGNLPARREGGPVSSGQTYLVGEAGPELFTPGRSGGILPADQTAALMSSFLGNRPSIYAPTPATETLHELKAIRSALAGLRPGVGSQQISIRNTYQPEGGQVSAMVQQSQLALLRSLQATLGG